MRKISILAIAFALLFTSASAQSVVSKVEYNKVLQSAVTCEYPFTPDVVEGAITAKFKSSGYSSKSTKGYDLYRMAKLPELGNESYDLYIKVERKSKREKDKAVVTLLLSTGFEKFVNDTTGTAILAKAQEYLNGLFPVIAAYDLELQIADQEELVKKADKKYSSAVDEGESLEKKKKKLEDDIADNIKDQAAKKQEAEAQRQVLQTLKAKRK